ncbi:MAG: peptidyl-prolyl cis-trans isomerase [Lachnospiraceae bacterium]|nr:peptidyl-prolyl cis-trans isomerase [Lachnospiraceae bacterium]
MKIKRIVSMLLAVTTAAALTLTGCGSKIDAAAVVANLDGQDISLGLANFMAQYTAVTYSMYASYFGENMWEQDLAGDGGTLEDSVKSEILEELELDYLLEAHMGEYGVELTQDELDEIDAAAEEFLSENSDKAIRVMGASKEYVTEMLRLRLIQNKMYSAITASADATVSDEEAAQKTISYIKVSTAGYYDEDSNYIAYTDEEKADLENTAGEIAELAKEDFEAAAEGYGYEVNTYSYGADIIDEEGNVTGALSSQVIETANALEEGEVSEAVYVEGDGYFIVRLDTAFDEAATEEKREEIISQRQTDKYSEVTEAYKDAASWTVYDEVWETVHFDELYNIVEDEAEAEVTESTEA